ncbi:MAG: hypothetical protein ABI601_05990 [bacterium]
MSAIGRALRTEAEPAPDAIWQWFGRLRGGLHYQPGAGSGDVEAGDADPNGCAAKLEMLRSSRYRFSDARMLSLGCNAGYYERHLIAEVDGVRQTGGSRRATAHLVDTDVAALTQAREAVLAAGAARVRVFAGPGERCRLAPSYDVALFLSLYHHYDRLGGRTRAIGRRLLARVGRRAQTMFFETGQNDDTVRGADRWRDTLEMGRSSRATDWLETAVPDIAGYDAWRRLGTNPQTGRALYVYWRQRRTPRELFLAPTGHHEGPIVAPLPVAGARLAPDVELVLATRERRPVLWDCAFTRQPARARATALGLATLLRSIAADDRDDHALLVHDPFALRWIPHDVPVQVDLGSGSLASQLGALATAGCSGARVVRASSHDAQLGVSAAAHHVRLIGSTVR